MSSLLIITLLLSPGLGGHAADRAAFTLALAAARADPAIPFDLEVDCTDGAERRSLEVMHGAVAVWNNSVQVRLSEKERTALIKVLTDANFSSFEARYGEVRKTDKQEAPLRVSCQVRVEIDGKEKSSVQLFDGEQSDRLLDLARALVDVVEPGVDGGITATSIEDGLAKLAAGELAPEVLKVRWLDLPGNGEEQPGFIVRVRGGSIERQAYAPGSDVGEITSSELTDSQLQTLIAAFEESQFWELPLNLQADGLTEIQLSILARSKTVVARSSFRSAAADEQAAFASLQSRLMELRQQ